MTTQPTQPVQPPKGLLTLQKIDASNVEGVGLSVDLQGDAKGGKTTGALSFPEPIVVAYCDPHDDTAAGFIKAGRWIELSRTEVRRLMAA